MMKESEMKSSIKGKLSKGDRKEGKHIQEKIYAKLLGVENSFYLKVKNI